MFRLIKTLASDIYDSFKTNDRGFSARKLAAFTVLMACIQFESNHITPDNLDSLMVTNLTFVAICLGLVTVQQIMSIKGGSTPPETPPSA
jgi:hypothetical protein